MKQLVLQVVGDFMLLVVLMCGSVAMASVHGHDPLTANNSGTVWCVNASCSQDTRYEYHHKEEELLGALPLEPPLWCPEGYGLGLMGDVWLHLCRPKSCIGIPSHNASNQPVTAGEQHSAEVCVTSFTATFQNCPKYGSLSESQYIVLANGSIWNGPKGEVVSTGDYWLRGKRAVVCDPSGTGLAASPPRWCMPFQETQNSSYWLLPNGTLYVDRINRTIPHDYFSENGSVANVCIVMDPALERCEHIMFNAEQIELKPDMDLLTTLGIAVIYPLGQYVLATDHSIALVCDEHGEQVRPETLYLYAVAASVSAFFLLLALVAHTFFPSLNYHTKALLCLAFSLFIMYIAMAIRNLARSFEASPVGNLTIFAIQYTFSLSAFFWLSVIAYDLWRVFSKMKGTITPGNSMGKKRVFLAKCIYAFGIPVVMCIIVVSIACSPSAQTQLGLDLPLELINWFSNTKTMFSFFYGPILIILIANALFFVVTVVNIRRASSGTDMVNKKISRKLLQVYFKLFLVMGVCWFAEVISWFAKSSTDEAAWYATDLINSLQGLFIFLIYICKRRTLIIIKNKLGYLSDNEVAQFTSSTQDSERKISTVNMANIQRKETSSSNDYSKM